MPFRENRQKSPMLFREADLTRTKVLNIMEAKEVEYG